MSNPLPTSSGLNFAGNLAPEGLRLSIIGIGGAGANVVDRLKLDELGRLDLTVVDSDAKVLSQSPLPNKVLVGRALTRGFGAGGDVEQGRKVAAADEAVLTKMVDGVDLVFLVAGLGGGIGSGVTPALARIAENAGALVVAFVTLPFTTEGGVRKKVAEDALVELRGVCHAVIPLPNDLLLQQGPEDATVLEALAVADSWISRGVRSIWSLLFRTGLINVDFATLRRSLSARGGQTLFGLGAGEGPDATAKALQDLELCPLLHTPNLTRKADSLVVHVTGGTELSLAKVNEILAVVSEKFGGRQQTTVGAVIDENFNGRVEICVLGTSDVTGRRGYRAAAPRAAHGGGDPVPAAVLSPSQPTVTAPPVKTKERNAAQQDEFAFQTGEDELRGYFEKTDRNLFDGEDLDVPTYLRRGLRIKIDV